MSAEESLLTFTRTKKEINMNSNGTDFIQLMDSFPCMFNLANVKKPCHIRLRFLLQKLEQEVKQEQEDFEGEKEQILNVLCWIYFQFGAINKAKEKNDEALDICPQNLMSLGNQIYLNWYSNFDLTTYQQRLEKMKTKPEFENETLKAKAGQAYFLLRVGDEYNLSSSFELFKEVIQTRPENYIWKYFQGLASRRAKTIRFDKDTKKLKDIFFDITENSKDANLKSLAFSELAAILAHEDEVPAAQVEMQIEKALSLNIENSIVQRNCGIALRRRENPRAIFHLEKAIAANPNSVDHCALARCYADVKLTNDMDRSECNRQAIHHFKAAFGASYGSNGQSLLHLAFFYRNIKMFKESEEQCSILIKCWRLQFSFDIPFYVSKLYHNMICVMRWNKRHIGDDLFDRYLSMAMLISLEYLKCRVSQKDKRSSVFNQIVDPSLHMLKGDNLTYHLFGMFNWCRNPRGARQILIELVRKGRLGEKEIEEKIQQLLSEDRADQALLVLDILDLDDDQVPAVSENLKRQVTLEEARWELSNGQIACKLLFHKMFNTSYSGQHTSSSDKEDEGEHRGADVLILYDAPQWKFFLHNGRDEPREDTESTQHYGMYEEVLFLVFGLEVMSNPMMPLSVDNLVDDEFFALVQHNNIKLILLLADEHTSDQFLQMADSVLGPILRDTTSEAVAMSTRTTSDVAIISCDGTDLSQKLPSLTDARYFDALENGFVRRLEDLPSDDLSGTEIIDAFFSGNIENAMNFFKFLAPPKH